MTETKIQKLDTDLVRISKKIKVLNTITWPPEAEDIFLNGWSKGT
jgi:hypothetical protein